MTRGSHLDNLIAQSGVTFRPQIRARLRLLDYQTYHKTFVDELGNFHALFTDGTIAWIRLVTGQIITVQLANLAQSDWANKSAVGRSPQKPTLRPSKKLINLLLVLSELDIELTPEQQHILDHHKRKCKTATISDSARS